MVNIILGSKISPFSNVIEYFGQRSICKLGLCVIRFYTSNIIIIKARSVCHTNALNLSIQVNLFYTYVFMVPSVPLNTTIGCFPEYFDDDLD